MMSNNTLPWILVITTWTANINDLIRGPWFFQSWEAIAFWNFIGGLAFLCIILGYKEKIKDALVSESAGGEQDAR